jgi:hypothetical protein
METKKNKPIRVQMYFGEHDREAYDDLVRVAKSTGLSVSEIAYASFVWGFYDLVRDDVFNMPLFQKGKNAKKKRARKAISRLSQ